MKRAQRRSMWERRLTAWRASGLPMTAYCAGKALSYSSMKRWRVRLGASAGGAKALAKVAPPVGALVPIELRSSASLMAIPAAAIEIRLRGGRAIVIEGEIDDARLVHLIGVVERAP